MNKNSIFGWASFILTLLGIALILLGVLKYPDYAIGFSVVGNSRVAQTIKLVRLGDFLNLKLSLEEALNYLKN